MCSVSLSINKSSKHFTVCILVPSASAAGVPAYRRALWGDVPQRLLVLPLDAGIWHPGQNQCGPQALILLHVYTQVACRGQQKLCYCYHTRRKKRRKCKGLFWQKAVAKRQT